MVALGFDVGLHEYSPKHALKKKVLECTMPTNKTRVQQWLGLVAQFGKHIDPHVLNEIRTVWSPITGDKKTIEDIPIEDRVRSFDLMKESVANIKPLYAVPEDANIMLRLEVDASKYGIGGWLYYLGPESEIDQKDENDTGQKDENGTYLRPNSEKDQKEEKDTKHVVAMGAHVLSKPAEKEWDTKTKELYAIWRFVKDWEKLLRGRHFEIVTDHANLTFSDKNSTEVQKRKLRYLSEFDYDLIWKAGEDNIVPDALSRIFGNIAKRVELEKGIEIEERISVQEPEARVMNQENASTNVDLSDNTPQWLIDCKRNEAGKYDIMEAWTAAVKAAHGEVYGKLNPMHRGINATLADAKKYFEEAELLVPNDARTSVTEFIWK